MSKPEWLAGLKEGDQVIIEQKRGLGRFQEVTTVHLTPAYIVAHCPRQQRTYNFRRSDGSRISRDAMYERITLAPYDKDTHLRICVTHMKARLEEALRHLTTDQIDALSPADCAGFLYAGVWLLTEISPPIKEEPAP